MACCAPISSCLFYRRCVDVPESPFQLVYRPTHIKMCQEFKITHYIKHTASKKNICCVLHSRTKTVFLNCCPRFCYLHKSRHFSPLQPNDSHVGCAVSSSGEVIQNGLLQRSCFKLVYRRSLIRFSVTSLAKPAKGIRYRN